MFYAMAHCWEKVKEKNTHVERKSKQRDGRLSSGGGCRTVNVQFDP